MPLENSGANTFCSESLPCSSTIACSGFGVLLSALTVGSLSLLAYSSQGLNCSEFLPCSESLPCAGFGVNLVPLALT